MAVNVATYFRFDAPIERASLEVEGRTTRFQVVDVGGSPAYATFWLVSHPALVDKEVEVVRRLRTPEVMDAEPARCEVNGPAMLVLSGLLDRGGVQVTEFQGRVPPENKSGLTSGWGTGYRATGWVVIAVSVRNLPGQKSWAPGSAHLVSAEGWVGRGRLVQLQGTSQLQPGESGLVVVEVDAPPSGQGPFRLELLDAEGGRLLPIHGVKFIGGGSP